MTTRRRVFNKAKNDIWVETDVCMSIIARFGTGGGNTPIIICPVNSVRNELKEGQYELPEDNGSSDGK